MESKGRERGVFWPCWSLKISKAKKTASRETLNKRKPSKPQRKVGCLDKGRRKDFLPRNIRIYSPESSTKIREFDEKIIEKLVAFRKFKELKVNFP